MPCKLNSIFKYISTGGQFQLDTRWEYNVQVIGSLVLKQNENIDLVLVFEHHGHQNINIKLKIIMKFSCCIIGNNAHIVCAVKINRSNERMKNIILTYYWFTILTHRSMLLWMVFNMFSEWTWISVPFVTPGCRARVWFLEMMCNLIKKFNSR